MRDDYQTSDDGMGLLVLLVVVARDVTQKGFLLRLQTVDHALQYASACPLECELASNLLEHDGGVDLTGVILIG